MSALATCTTGYAVVRFRVDREGRVHDPEVTESQPSAVFNEAAITAVMASRFEPRANGSGPLDTTLTQKIDFAAPSNCIPFDTGEPGSDDFDEDAARNACFASGGNQWGFAELHFVVSPAGQASQVEVHRATDGDLSDKARAALAREQFEPRFAGQTLSRVLEFCSR